VSSGASPLLNRARIEGAFRRLGERLAQRGVIADLYVFGGAAMALAYDVRRATRDIDAIFQPHGRYGRWEGAALSSTAPQRPVHGCSVP